MELMVVIVIIGAVYALVVSKLQNVQKEKSLPTLSRLKSYVASFVKDGKKATLLCSEACKKCEVFRDGSKVADVESFFDASIERYRYDFFMGDVFLESQNCFEFSVDAKGVSDQVFVLYKGKVYDYTPYFDELHVYDSLGAFHTTKEQLVSEVK